MMRVLAAVSFTPGLRLDRSPTQMRIQPTAKDEPKSTTPVNTEFGMYMLRGFIFALSTGYRLLAAPSAAARRAMRRARPGP
ncbi:MAG TPA: hypothetical protein VKH13_12445, partial [Steroidobacteraceae bacterium]|nr:hypothetical protein [Steroidobacteraceae bacterium]